MEGLTNLSYYLNINAHKFVEIILYKNVHFPFYQFHRRDSEYLHQAFIMLSTKNSVPSADLQFSC